MNFQLFAWRVGWVACVAAALVFVNGASAAATDLANKGQFGAGFLPAGPGGPDCFVGTITNVSAPTVSGSGAVRSSIVTTNGTWNPCTETITGYMYSWTRDGVPVAGATASSYWTLPADVGHVIRSTVVACIPDGCSDPVTSSNGITVSGSVPATAVSMVDNGGSVDFTNNDGTWHFYTSCSAGIGPGYAARFQAKSGAVVWDDAHPPTNGTDMGTGEFVFEEARANKDTTPPHGPTLFNGSTDRSGVQTWTTSSQPGWTLHGGGVYWKENGRTYVEDGGGCANSQLTQYDVNRIGVNPDSNYTHTMSATFEGGATPSTPAYDANADIGYLNEVVTFEDPYSSAVLKVIYQWKIYPNTVKMWTDVIQLCDSGACGTEPDGVTPAYKAWVKGPKFIVGIDNSVTGQIPENYNQMTIYDASGNGLCARADVGDPSVGTTQCGAFASGTNCPAPPTPCSRDQSGVRSRIQFNYAYTAAKSGNADPSWDPNCTNTTDPVAPGDGCFNAVFRSYSPDVSLYSGSGLGLTPGNAASYWMSGGLQSWANHMESRPSEQDSQPSPCPDINGNCWRCHVDNGWNDVHDVNSGGATRWELVDVKPGTARHNPFTSADAWVFGWEDCVNVETASSYFRQYEAANTNYAVYGSFGFDKPGVFSHYDMNGQN